MNLSDPGLKSRRFFRQGLVVDFPFDRHEIVDIEARVERLLPILDEMVTEGLVTVQDVHVFKYVHSAK